ncbi:putative ATP synthase (E 31 kDa) subunit [Trypanosoma vivax]|uniref:ATP synthase, putative n=1 Tax=Trypanosoma vivax (strain Y486) TaxID=1055687 RepID=F9WKY8_TRYVY|nr:putative ATP synthase (E 31 kDa) subunit [Trypanosoma vivax]CCD18172.1 ATP synthase, putative [Trypanosoma vivax Y486]|eukprot:CCD18172.1 ATP synthase, putative [Trypanosoma vivax Y486]
MTEERQIQSMIDFIERETQEKADELNSAAQEEYDLEKMGLVEAEKVKARATGEKKIKQVDVDRRVARANFPKIQRLRIMEEQSKIVDQLKENVKKKLLTSVRDTRRYSELLVKLIHEALLAVRAKAVIHVCKDDESLVKNMVSDLNKWYEDKLGTPTSITLSKDYLSGEEAWGGVLVKSEDGHIVCNWTLSSRMRNCLNDQLPTIRYYLFDPDASF